MKTPLILIAALSALPAYAQHTMHHSPYQGQESRGIKALSEDEVK